MKYRLFGRSGLRVSEVALGTMTFGDAWGTSFGAPGDESERIFRAYVDAGGNFVDTANGYTAGQSESLLGEWIAPMRERIVLATKYTFLTRDGDPNAGGNHRKNLVQSLDASLKRLRTDYIDVYWVHIWDFTTPVEEVMRALDDQVRAGKILHVGVSNTPAWIVAQANALASLRGWSPFIGLQIEYNLAERTSERELLPLAEALGLGVVAWSPLASGLLTGKHRTGAVPGNGATSGRKALIERMRGAQLPRTIDALLRVAEQRRTPPAHVALAWLAGRRGDVIPILGAKTLDQLAQNLGYLDVRLSEAEIRELDDASAVELGYPHEFIEDARHNRLPGGLWGVPLVRISYAETVVV